MNEINLHLTKDEFNFEEILERIRCSQKVWVTSYGLGNPDRSPILRAIREMKEGSEAVVISAVPGRIKKAEPADREQRDSTTESLVKALDPSSFTCSFTGWYCFENHSKIILCDDIAYVGSANATNGSSKNFEAGVTIRSREMILELSNFLEQIRMHSVPHANVRGSEKLRTILDAAKDLITLRNSFEEDSLDWSYDELAREEVSEINPETYEVPDSLLKFLKRLKDMITEISNLPQTDSEK